MNSLPEYLLHYADLTVVAQTRIMMLLETLLIQRKKASETELNILIIPQNHGTYLSNISVTQGFRSLQIHTQESDSMRTLQETPVTMTQAAVTTLIRQSIK